MEVTWNGAEKKTNNKKKIANRHSVLHHLTIAVEATKDYGGFLKREKIQTTLKFSIESLRNDDRYGNDNAKK